MPILSPLIAILDFYRPAQYQPLTLVLCLSISLLNLPRTAFPLQQPDQISHQFAEYLPPRLNSFRSRSPKIEAPEDGIQR